MASQVIERYIPKNKKRFEEILGRLRAANTPAEVSRVQLFLMQDKTYWPIQDVLFASDFIMSERPDWKPKK